MADVSVRFQVAGDSEIVLNLGTAEAVRLVEAIMRKVAEAMSGSGLGNPAPGGQALGNPGMGGQQLGVQRAAVGPTWPEIPPSGQGMPPTR
ncbi:hypothetical protein [Frankia sp. AiPa1]|uniref:hypothetical protein n=1 Tax=Frankia sp. AiPa1 TaxID=573492 RepID=UPI00202B2D91|nr:hypothetical protein [Frankia sp. AiPa1]MCL9757936.1 hypothetical protein [Frankia sp. AiPa1]